MNPLLDPDARLVIAHRGSSSEAPENTLRAFEAAVGRGADAIELDVRLTADGAPVVIHDATLDRTTDRTGPVAALTLAELRAVDAGWHFTFDQGRTNPCRGSDVRIPTLGSPKPMHPQVALASDGSLVVAWDELLEGRRVSAARRLTLAAYAAPTFGAIVRLPADGNASHPVLATSSAGVLAVWTSGGDDSQVRAGLLQLP